MSFAWLLSWNDKSRLNVRGGGEGGDIVSELFLRAVFHLFDAISRAMTLPVHFVSDQPRIET